MFEDVAGNRAAVTGQAYATCEECGEVFLRRAACPEIAGMSDGAHSEWMDLCPSCEALDRQGERTFLPTEPE